MPKNRLSRFVFALIVLALLSIIGRNVYRHFQEKSLLDAVQSGNDDTAIMLLKQGVYAQNLSGLQNLLFDAIDHNEPNTVRMLLQRGVDPNNTPDRYRNFPILSLASFNCPSVFALLVEKGADVNAKDSDGSTALYNCVQNRRLALAHLMLEHGADPNNRDTHYGFSPLWMAAQKEDLPMLSLLLSHGAHIYAEPANANPLVAAMEHKSLDTLRFLLEHGAGEDAKTNALAQALQWKNYEAMRLLLAHGARPSEESPAWLLALGQAHSQGDTAALARLTSLGVPTASSQAERQVKNGDKQTPLQAALAQGKRVQARYWLAQGAEVNVKDRQDRTPLMEAIDHCPDLVPVLMAKGANSNIMTYLKETPLLRAVRTGNVEVVRQLLQHGADANLHAPRSHTPLYVARKHKNTEVVRLLQQAGGKEE